MILFNFDSLLANDVSGQIGWWRLTFLLSVTILVGGVPDDVLLALVADVRVAAAHRQYPA